MALPAKNIFWLSISRIAALVLLFIAYRSLFRYLGPFSSGQYQFVLSYVTIFGIIIDFGLQQYIIKRISEEPAHAKRYFQNFLAVEVILAIVIFISLVTIAKLNHYDPIVVHAIIVAGLGTAINGLTYPFLSVMSAFYDLKKVAFINFLSSIVNVSTIFAVIYFHKHIVLLASNQVIFAVLSLTIYSFLIRKHIPKPEVLNSAKSLDWPLVRHFFFAALPFALLVGFSTIYNRIDVVLIAHKLGYEQTGFYTAAYKFFDLLAFFPAVVSHSLYPVFAALMAARDLPAVRRTFETYLRFLLAVALPMGMGGMLLARPVIIFLAGAQYADGAAALAILAWAPAVLFIYIIANALVISQLTKFAVGITGTNVVINVLGNLILLPRVGIRGAAIMTLVSEFLQGAFYFYFVKKKIIDFSFFAQAWRPALGSLIMGVVLWKLRAIEISSNIGINLLFWIVVSSLVYGLTLLILQFFQKDDLVFIKKFLKPQAA